MVVVAAGLGLAALIALEVNLGVPALPDWLPFAVLLPVAAAVLLWFGRSTCAWSAPRGDGRPNCGSVRRTCRSASSRGRPRCRRSAKSAALGRQLDPAAYVVHRAWVGPMVLLVLDDPDDPTPYWLVSCRRPRPRAGGAAQLSRDQAAQSVQIITPFFSLASRLR